MSRAMAPTGANPPTEMRTAAGVIIELVPLAREICTRYRREFPDEDGRYGAAGDAWCLHDNQYVLAWAIQDARDGTVDLVEQSLWLGDLLARRGFPAGRLARSLEIASAVVEEIMVADVLTSGVAARLTAAAGAVRAAGAPTGDPAR